METLATLFDFNKQNSIGPSLLLNTKKWEVYREFLNVKVRFTLDLKIARAQCISVL